MWGDDKYNPQKSKRRNKQEKKSFEILIWNVNVYKDTLYIWLTKSTVPKFTVIRKCSKICPINDIFT